MTHLTKHAEQRLKERLGLNKSATQRMSDKAYEQGLTHKELRGNLFKWVTKQYFSNTQINNLRVYGDYLWLYEDKLLVTVIAVPSNLKKLIADCKARRDKSD